MGRSTDGDVGSYGGVGTAEKGDRGGACVRGSSARVVAAIEDDDAPLCDLRSEIISHHYVVFLVTHHYLAKQRACMFPSQRQFHAGLAATATCTLMGRAVKCLIGSRINADSVIKKSIDRVKQ